MGDLGPRQLMLAMMLGASCAFATPIGCQTNLMVLAAGGYRFSDFPKLGGLLTLVVGTTSATLIWLIGLADPAWSGRGAEAAPT